MAEDHASQLYAVLPAASMLAIRGDRVGLVNQIAAFTEKMDWWPGIVASFEFTATNGKVDGGKEIFDAVVCCDLESVLEAHRFFQIFGDIVARRTDSTLSL